MRSVLRQPAVRTHRNQAEPYPRGPASPSGHLNQELDLHVGYDKPEPRILTSFLDCRQLRTQLLKCRSNFTVLISHCPPPTANNILAQKTSSS